MFQKDYFRILFLLDYVLKSNYNVHQHVLLLVLFNRRLSFSLPVNCKGGGGGGETLTRGSTDPSLPYMNEICTYLKPLKMYFYSELIVLVSVLFQNV